MESAPAKLGISSSSLFTCPSSSSDPLIIMTLYEVDDAGPDIAPANDGTSSAIALAAVASDGVAESVLAAAAFAAALAAFLSAFAFFLASALASASATALAAAFAAAVAAFAFALAVALASANALPFGSVPFPPPFSLPLAPFPELAAS